MRALTLIVCMVGVASVLLIRAERVSPTAPLPLVGSLGGPDRALSGEEANLWLAGRLLFDRDTHSTSGLGGGASGDFNGDSCRACHQDPVVGGASDKDLNVSRFARDEGGVGPFTNLPGGQIVSRHRRPDTLGREEIPVQADLFEQRNAPSLLGLGLLDRVLEPDILALQDPTDANSDGVFGVARMLNIAGTMELGRFGWKAQVPTIRDFADDAMGAELGVTVPSNARGFGDLTDGDGVPDPEISNNELDALVFFMEHLAPPARGGSTNPLVAVGESLFQSIGCATCHVPSLPSPSGPVRAYTNLLLHNVQDLNFRGMEEPGAPNGFYRTPPLWGISETAPYWHDGRAEDLNQAILLHSGEGLTSRLAYQALGSADRSALLLFLGDL